MEEKVIKASKENRDLVIDKHKLFEWKVDKEEVKGTQSVLTFSRDNEVPYYRQLVELENQFPEYKFLPFILIIIFAALAFISITVLLIVFLANRDLASTYWLAFIIPSGVFLVIAMVFTFLRMRTLDKVINEKRQKESEFALKIKKLKDN